mgnify:CR=1 FL=1
MNGTCLVSKHIDHFDFKNSLNFQNDQKSYEKAKHENLPAINNFSNFQNKSATIKTLIK